MVHFDFLWKCIIHSYWLRNCIVYFNWLWDATVGPIAYSSMGLALIFGLLKVLQVSVYS